jgi:hypothetical protein
MKFFWQLNDQQKFDRALWGGLVSLIFLFIVVLLYMENTTNKIGLIIFMVIIYLADLTFRYRKVKQSK